jgi:cullin-associated NEDD8-dissociated protein 1
LVDANSAIRYEDEEDQSYKIRRASTKLLGAVLATRPELLPTLYKDVSPVLIQRFGDREETVRLEVWTTYGVFLTQTRVYGGTFQSSAGKRKRDSDGMEVEETAQSLLKTQVPALSKALLAQMKSPKANPSTLQAGYELLSALLLVLPGSLGPQATLIASISKNVLSQPPTTTNSGLHLACLPFLRAFFATHSPASLAQTVPVLTPVLATSLREKHPRISAETFGVFSALLATAKPVKAGDWADAVYNETLVRLSKSDTDAEVRVAAEEITGDLWVYAPDVVASKGGKEWESVCRTTGQVETAVKVVTRVAREGDVSEAWLNSMVEWISTLLRKGGKSGKVEAFMCLEAIIGRYDVSLITNIRLALMHECSDTRMYHPLCLRASFRRSSHSSRFKTRHCYHNPSRFLWLCCGGSRLRPSRW